MTSHWIGVLLLAVVLAVLALPVIAAVLDTLRHLRGSAEPPAADPARRYPRLGETYIDRRPNALAMVHRCTHPEYHGPRLCEPEWHKIVLEERQHQQAPPASGACARGVGGEE